MLIPIFENILEVSSWFFIPSVFMLGVITFFLFVVIRTLLDTPNRNWILLIVPVLLGFPVLAHGVGAILYFVYYALRILYCVWFTSGTPDIPQWLFFLSEPSKWVLRIKAH